VHVDAGISGKAAANRPGLQAALDDACRTGAAVVVYSLSRLARSTKDAIAISERLSKADADLVSLSESIDTTTAAGKMVFRMLAVMAEFERDAIAERTTAAMSHKRQLGQRISGRLPYGYDLADDGQTLIENAVELEAVALMQQLRRDGLSLRRICDELVSRGIANKGGDVHWTAAVVNGILRRAA